jgi:hypothetical protein
MCFFNHVFIYFFIYYIYLSYFLYLFIFIHSLSEHQIIDGENPKQWFLIIPSKKIELGFLNEAELKSYVEQYNIIKINWIQAQDLYNQFKDSECLPWIPGCSE